MRPNKIKKVTPLHEKKTRGGGAFGTPPLSPVAGEYRTGETTTRPLPSEGAIQRHTYLEKKLIVVDTLDWKLEVLC